MGDEENTPEISVNIRTEGHGHLEGEREEKKGGQNPQVVTPDKDTSIFPSRQNLRPSSNRSLLPGGSAGTGHWWWIRLLLHVQETTFGVP